MHLISLSYFYILIFLIIFSFFFYLFRFLIFNKSVIKNDLLKNLSKIGFFFHKFFNKDFIFTVLPLYLKKNYKLKFKLKNLKFNFPKIHIFFFKYKLWIYIICCLIILFLFGFILWEFFNPPGGGGGGGGPGPGPGGFIADDATDVSRATRKPRDVGSKATASVKSAFVAYVIKPLPWSSCDLLLLKIVIFFKTTLCMGYIYEVPPMMLSPLALCMGYIYAVPPMLPPILPPLTPHLVPQNIAFGMDVCTIVFICMFFFIISSGGPPFS